MTPLEKIDFVFFYIREKLVVGGNWGYNNIWNHVRDTKELDMNETMFKEIIVKLKNDGFLTEINGNNSQSGYHITFNGLIFQGYVTEELNNQKELHEVRSLRQATVDLQRVLNRLTCWIVIGSIVAAVYYILEILNHFFCIYPK